MGKTEMPGRWCRLTTALDEQVGCYKKAVVRCFGNNCFATALQQPKFFEAVTGQVLALIHVEHPSVL